MKSSASQLRSKSAGRTLSPSELKNPTQRNALKILEREEQNAKKNRIETLLTHQFLSKYGTKAAQSAINSFIKAKIHSFVNSYADISRAESDLEKLEAEIRDQTNNMRMEMRESKVTRSDISSYQQEQGNNNRNDNSGNRLMNSGLQTLRELRESSNPNNQLTLLNAILSVNEEEKKRQDKQAMIAKQMKFKNDLDEQLLAQQRAQIAKESEKVTQFSRIQQEQNAYEQEQLTLKLEKHEKAKLEREIRAQQIEERKLERERERLLRIAEEKAEMARAKKLAELEEEKKQQLKEKQKMQQEILLMENERNKELKQRELQQKFAYEKKLNEDYERKLEEEERARQNAFSQRMQQLQSIASKYESGIGQQIQQQKKQEEDKVYQDLQRKYEADEREQIRRQELRKQQILEATKFNQSLIEQKQKRKADERQRDIDMRKELEKQSKESKRNEDYQQEMKKQQYLDLRAKLAKQIEDQKQNKLSEKLSFANTENQTLLKKLEEDPAMLSKVMTKIHQTGEVTQRNKVNGLF